MWNISPYSLNKYKTWTDRGSSKGVVVSHEADGGQFVLSAIACQFALHKKYIYAKYAKYIYI